MATAGNAKTKIVNGVRTDATTGQPYTGATGAIALDSLQANSTPAKIPAVTPTPYEATGFQGVLESQADAFTKGLDAKTKTAETGKNDALGALVASLKSSSGETQLQDTAYSKAGGVDALEADLKDTNDQLLREQESLRRKEQLITKNAGGMETDAVNNEVARARTESLSRQADLSVIQLAKQGKYDSAKAIADRAVAVKVEQDKQRNSILQLIYDDNKDLFTTAEQRQFEVAQKDREGKIEVERAKEMARFDALIKQSDPLYQQQLKAAVAENNTSTDLSASGFTTQPAYASLTTTQKKQATSLNDLVRSLNDYYGAVDTYADEGGAKFFGTGAAILETKLNSIMFAAAQAEGTGALQAADRAVIEKIIPNPTSFTGGIGAAFKGGKKAQLLQITDQIGKYTANLGTLGLTPVVPSKEEVADPLGLGIGSTALTSNPLGI